LIVVTGCLLQVQAIAGDACPPPAYSMQQLFQLKQTGFKIDDAGERNALALALAACVGDPDPAMRDGVVFEGLSSWMRGQQLTSQTIMALYENLRGQISSDADPDGFQQPFAALILSEIARTDRVEASFTPAMRAQLVELSANYLSRVRDYRGFSDTEGWRHGVAHGSDLVLQLVLNPNIDAAQIQQLMASVASQVAPEGEVFYIFGEPGRLARSVIYAYRRGILEDAAWAGWFDSISDPQPLKNWSASYTSRMGLARRHNTLAFLMAMHLNAIAAGDEQGEALAEIVMQTISRVLRG